MSRRRDELAADLVFDRILDAGLDGITAIALGDALRAARLGDVSTVGWAVHKVRQTLGDDVIVYDRKAKVYRRARDLQDAESWRRHRAFAIHSQLVNLHRYTTAEANRFATEIVGTAWKMADDSLERAATDLQRAAEMTFGKTVVR
jgi:hypothetical protein